MGGKQQRIALIGVTPPFRGGISHFTTMLAQKLQERGHEVLVVGYKRLYPNLLFPGKTQIDPSKKGIASVL